MTRLAVQLVLILAVALGSPVAACCRLAAMVGDGLAGGVHGSQSHRCCSCCEDPGTTPAAPTETPKQCDCGPAKTLFAQSHATSKAAASDAVAFAAPAHAASSPDAPAYTSIATFARSRPPPCSLVALHCALTV